VAGGRGSTAVRFREPSVQPLWVARVPVQIALAAVVVGTFFFESAERRAMPTYFM